MEGNYLNICSRLISSCITEQQSDVEEAPATAESDPKESDSEKPVQLDEVAVEVSPTDRRVVSEGEELTLEVRAPQRCSTVRVG